MTKHNDKRNAIGVFLLLACALFLMGAKGCSNCDQARALRLAACSQAPDGQMCKEATEAVAKCEATPVPTPTPTPVPTPTPTPTPIPTPTPDPDPHPVCAHPGPDAEFQVVTPRPAPNRNVTMVKAIAEVQAKYPLWFTLDKERLAEWDTKPHYDLAVRYMNGVGASLGGFGYCAYVDHDALLVQSDDAVWSEYKLIGFEVGNLIAVPNAYLGMHRLVSAGDNPVVSCSPPSPLGQSAFWLLKLHNMQAAFGPGVPANVYDATLKIKSREWCESAGFPGQGGCAVRPERHPEREACEHVLVGGDGWPLATWSGGRMEPHLNNNPFLYKVDKGPGTLKVCTYSGVCGEISQ